jgi:hypothetical protein
MFKNIVEDIKNKLTEYFKTCNIKIFILKKNIFIHNSLDFTYP